MRRDKFCCFLEEEFQQGHDKALLTLFGSTIRKDLFSNLNTFIVVVVRAPQHSA